MNGAQKTQHRSKESVGKLLELGGSQYHEWGQVALQPLPSHHLTLLHWLHSVFLGERPSILASGFLVSEDTMGILLQFKYSIQYCLLIWYDRL